MSRRLSWAISRASAALLIEQIWPRVSLVALIGALFLIVSWFGLWQPTPDYLRLALVGLFGLSFIGGLVWAFRPPPPTRNQAMRRVEEASGLTGRPLEALQDIPFDTSTRDGRALWSAHTAQVAAKVKKLSVGTPNPRTDRLDPMALRAPVLLLLFVAFFVAGPERGERVLAAFDPPYSIASTPVRLDIWATPPAYTGLPPRTLISRAEMGDDASSSPAVHNLSASLPVGSRITILSSSDAETAPVLTAHLLPADGGEAIDLEPDDTSGATANLNGTLMGDGTLVVRAGRNELSLPLASLADAPPAISFADDVDSTAAGAMVLSYTGNDDYGIVAADTIVTPAEADFAGANHLIEPPSIALTIPSPSGDVTSMTRDLSAHPWAGLPISLQLRARDGADQIGVSEARTVMLPQRAFREPLARAIVEQRRILAVDPSRRAQILTALESFSYAAELFMEDEYGAFLALTVTTQRLRQAREAEAQRDVIELMWQLALEIEDGDLAGASERLRQAEQNLSDALEQGASDQEIAELMAELRDAFDQYMQALAQQMQAFDPENAMPQNMPLSQLDPQAMQSMMDQIEQLAEMGAADAARQMLDQLREQLDALRGAQAMQPQQMSPEEQAAREAMQALQSITREQQRLMEETFPFSQDAQRQEIRPPSPFRAPFGEPRTPDNRGDSEQSERGDGDNGDRQADRSDPLEGLEAEQRGLQEQLQELMDQLRELGLDPGALGEADDAMGGAEQMLGRGSAQGALPEQGRALEALQSGAQQLAQQMAGDGEGQGQAQGQGQGQQQGQGAPRLQFGPGQGQRGFDPLGRPQRAQQGDNQERVGIPEERDIQRARDILQEIQRRLGERERPRVELDYLDRLIDRF
ncbi:MAG: TIGR02302 family protein [Pseudomonadota bacterium]